MYSRYFYKNFAENKPLDDSTVRITTERSGDDTTGYIKYSDGVVKFWSSVNVNMTLTTSQTFSPPAGANPIGRVRAFGALIALGSANSYNAWGLVAVRWNGSWDVRIITAGTSASDLVVLSGEGRWK